MRESKDMIDSRTGMAKLALPAEVESIWVVSASKDSNA
jgi:hypothetical protein